MRTLGYGTCSEQWALKTTTAPGHNPIYACSETRSRSGNKQCWVLLLTHDQECLTKRTEWTPGSSDGLLDDDWLLRSDVMFGDVLSGCGNPLDSLWKLCAFIFLSVAKHFGLRCHLRRRNRSFLLLFQINKASVLRFRPRYWWWAEKPLEPSWQEAWQWLEVRSIIAAGSQLRLTTAWGG